MTDARREKTASGLLTKYTTLIGNAKCSRMQFMARRPGGVTTCKPSMEMRMKAELRAMMRSARRLFWRKLLRLRDVHPTVLFGGYGDISRDFHADAYVYVGPGCRINPGVRVGS